MTRTTAASRACSCRRSPRPGRSLLSPWQHDHDIEPQNVLDNSGLDLDELIGWMTVDFDVVESKVTGAA